MRIIAFILVLLISQVSFATVLSTSNSEGKIESPYLNKKFLLNLSASAGVVGARAGYFVLPRWGVIAGQDLTKLTSDSVAALAYRWSSQNTAMETVTLKAGAYSSQKLNSNTDIKNPYGLILEADVAISLAPKADSLFLMLGVSSKSYSSDENPDIVSERGSSLFHAGLGVVL